MNAPSPVRLTARIDKANPNHHLWLNHGTWWIHYTLDLAGLRTKRVRRSLAMSDLDEARLERDRLFALLGGQR